MSFLSVDHIMKDDATEIQIFRDEVPVFWDIPKAPLIPLFFSVFGHPAGNALTARDCAMMILQFG